MGNGNWKWYLWTECAHHPMHSKSFLCLKAIWLCYWPVSSLGTYNHILGWMGYGWMRQFPWWPLTPSPLCINPQHSTGITTILYWNHKYAHSLNMSSSHILRLEKNKTQVGSMVHKGSYVNNRAAKTALEVHRYKYRSQNKTPSVDIAAMTICQCTQFSMGTYSIQMLHKIGRTIYSCPSRPHWFSLENKNELDESVFVNWFVWSHHPHNTRAENKETAVSCVLIAALYVHLLVTTKQLVTLIFSSYTAVWPYMENLALKNADFINALILGIASRLNLHRTESVVSILSFHKYSAHQNRIHTVT